MSNRGTGRTTKIVQDAVAYAQTGSNCFFLVHDVSMIDYCVKIFRTISPDCVKTGRNRLIVPGGGWVQFIRKWSERIEANDEGQPLVDGYSEKVFIDHAVYDNVVATPARHTIRYAPSTAFLVTIGHEATEDELVEFVKKLETIMPGAHVHRFHGTYGDIRVSPL